MFLGIVFPEFISPHCQKNDAQKHETGGEYPSGDCFQLVYLGCIHAVFISDSFDHRPVGNAPFSPTGR
jgi:hypothetical protein